MLQFTRAIRKSASSMLSAASQLIFAHYKALFTKDITDVHGKIQFVSALCGRLSAAESNMAGNGSGSRWMSPMIWPDSSTVRME